MQVWAERRRGALLRLNRLHAGQSFEQLFSVAGVVAQIGDDQSIAAIARVNLGQGSGTRIAVEVLRQLAKCFDANWQ